MKIILLLYLFKSTIIKQKNHDFPKNFFELPVPTFDDNLKKPRNVDPQNRSESDEIVYVCEKNFSDICNCNYQTNHLQCKYLDDHRIHTANLGIRNQRFILKSAFLWVDIENLKKGKILPGREHTVEDLRLNPFGVKSFENGTFDAFDKLKSLHLQIRDNSIMIDNRILTKKLGTTLESLTLKHYFVNEIPSTIFQYLTKLKLLDLSSSKVQFSKELFSKSLANLESLELENCNITSLDDDIFANLKNLKQLDLGGNPVTSIPKAINFLPNLNRLYLHHTDITEINSNELTPNSSLKELILSDTQNLKSIGDCAFCNFPNLEEVDLSSTELENIHENAFGRLTGKNPTQLKKFRIDYTGITVLPEKLLDWKSVRELYLSDNSYICNCSMAWLINNYKNYRRNLIFLDYKKIKSLQCANPPALKDKRFDEISLENCDSNNAATHGPEITSTEINKEQIVVAEEKPISKFLIAAFLFFIIGFIFVMSYATYRHFKARKEKSTHEFERINDGMAMDDL